MSVIHPQSLICRVCLLENAKTFNIYGTKLQGVLNYKVCDMIPICASVQVSKGDGLPEQMCLKCVEALTRSFLFKQQCEKSDALVRSSLHVSWANGANIKLEFEGRKKPDFEFVDCPVGEKQTVPMASQNILESSSSESTRDIESPGEPTLFEYEEKVLKDENMIDIKEEGVSFGSETKMDVIQNEVFKCRQCGSSFESKFNLDTHKCNENQLRKKEQETVHICRDCNKPFHGKNLFAIHMWSHPEFKLEYDEKQLTCQFCSKRYSYIGQLKRHIMEHVAKERYECKKCRRSFKLPSLWGAHQSDCDGKRYHCKVCAKSFTYPSQLSTHMVMHSPSRLKLHKCAFCPKSFRNMDQLNSHLEDLHLQTTQGVEIFECDFCDSKFRLLRNLNVHKKTHIGEKAFVCRTCHKKFLVKANLEAHMQSHTTNESS